MSRVNMARVLPGELAAGVLINLLLERAIGLEAEVLLGERGHQSVDCRRSGEAM